MEKKEGITVKKEEFYEDDEIDLYQLWLTIKKRKKLIISIFLFAIFATAVISFIMTPIYRSESSLMPITSSSTFDRLAGLASIAGVSVGGDNESAKVIAVLNSRTIKERVIKEMDLIPVLIKEPPENRNPLNIAVAIMGNIISVSENKKTGVLNLYVEHKDPMLAQKIGESYIKNLQQIMNEKALTLAKVNRLFLEKQLKDEEKKLKRLREELAQFQKKNKIIEPSRQLTDIMNLYANLIARKMELTVKLRSMETALSPNNPQIKMIQEQLSAVSKQIKSIEEKTNIGALPSLSQAPEKLLKYADIIQHIKVSESIYETLMRMYEQAKLEESKNNIYVEVIDPPSLPDKPIKPKKKLMVAVAGISSLFLGIFLAFFLEWLENIKKRRTEQDYSM